MLTKPPSHQTREPGMHPSPACPELCRREFWILTPGFSPKIRNEPNSTKPTANRQQPKAAFCETNPIRPHSHPTTPKMRNEPNRSPGGPVEDPKMRNEPNSHTTPVPPASHRLSLLPIIENEPNYHPACRKRLNHPIYNIQYTIPWPSFPRKQPWLSSFAG